MIEALSLHARNFGSWTHFEFSLDNQGFVGIVGKNGAGKSTLWRALHWCLYGTTPDPIPVDEVRRKREPAGVCFRFRKDGNLYTITRYRKHPQYGNKVFFSGYGVPETVEDSHVKTVQGHIERVFGMSELVFRTTTYFAQGHFQHFHTLTDQGKKSYLEAITYNSIFERCELMTRERARAVEGEIDHLERQLQGLAQSIEAMKMQSAKQRDIIVARIATLRSAIAVCEIIITDATHKRQSLCAADDHTHALTEELYSVSRKLHDAETDAERYSIPNQLCPRCGLVMLENLRRDRLADAQHRVEKWQRFHAKATKLHAQALKRSHQLRQLNADLHEARRVRDGHIREIAVLRSSLQSATDIQPLLRQQKQLTKELHTQKLQLQYLSFWSKGFSLQGLRAMVLGKAIAHFTQRVRAYLQQMTGDKIDFQCSLERNRFLIQANGRSYWSFSGGERQALDVATGFALRDLAEAYNKCSSNLLILDEPNSSFDEEVDARVQSFLRQYAKPSTFVITHRKDAVVYDKMYRIVKRQDTSHLILNP